MIGSIAPDADLKNEDFPKPEDIEEGENFVSPSDNPEEDKENSRDLMGSIGSWINEFFNVPAKRPATVPQVVKPKMKSREENMQLDTEYLKSFNDFKEQMKKKLKSETTVHLSTGDKSVEFNFDKLTDKSKKKSNWLSPLECSKPVDGSKKKAEMILHNPQPPVHRFPIKINEKENIYVAISPEDSTNVKETVLINENLLKKERSKNGKLEEYFFTTPLELSKSLLLNINDHEKCSQLYNNTHARIQEPQPYQLRRTNSYQRNARCYTTNANLVENSKASSLMSNKKHKKSPAFYTCDSTAASTADECSSPKKKMLKRKTFPEVLGEESSFGKIRSAKSLNISFSDSGKLNETKTSSEELVKTLVKKTKVTGRPQPFKKKPKCLLAESNPKSRFLQSATTSLVVNVLSKKENLLSLRAGSRLVPESKNLKLDREPKEWPPKQRDMKYEIKKLASPKFNKSSYLSDINDKAETQNDNASLKPFGRLYENAFLSSGRDAREKNGKIKKGQDIKCILSKIDGRYDKLRAQQKLKKTEEKSEQCETQETQNARFQKQHELFKKLPASAEQTESSEVCEPKCKIEKCDSSITTPSPSEIVVLNAEIQSMSKIPEERENYELTVVDKTQSLPLLSDNFGNAKNEILDRMYVNEKPLSVKAEKNEMPDFKNKLVKTKSLQYLKEDDMRALINSGTELPIHESQSEKEISKVCERQLPPTEIRPRKSLEPVMLNRSYSTTMIKNQKSTKLIPFGHPKNILMLSDKKDFCKKNIKDKKNEKNEKNEKPTSGKEVTENCDFKPIKKPGPNCEN